MMVIIPPGPRFILRHAPHFLIPSLATYAALVVIAQFGWGLPRWACITAAILARPAIFLLNQSTLEWRLRRAAKAHGAVLAPAVPKSSLECAREIMFSVNHSWSGDAWFDWARSYGETYSWTMFSDYSIFTTEPVHLKTILATEAQDYPKGEECTGMFDSMLGTGIFNSDGSAWKFHRSIIRPYFTKDRIRDFDLFDKHANSAMSLIGARVKEGVSVDIVDIASRFTLDASSEFLFGHSVNSIAASTHYPKHSGVSNPEQFHTHPSNGFSRAFSDGTDISNKRFGFSSLWPLTEFWSDAVAPYRKVVDDYIEPIITEAIQRKEKMQEIEKDVEPATVLDHLVNDIQDPQFLKDEIVNVLLAGRDTTASSLTFISLKLAEHPEAAQKLREEIIGKVGPFQRPTLEKMRELTYTRAFINEVMRLYPPVPDVARTSAKAKVLPPAKPGAQPIYVPPNTIVLYSFSHLHRRTDLWGPDANTFDPDRFIDDRLHKYLVPNPFIFLPFSAGPRICVGQQFAYHQITFFLVRLIQQFTNFRLDKEENLKPPAHWKSSEGWHRDENFAYMTTLTSSVKGGLWVYMDEYHPEA